MHYFFPALLIVTSYLMGSFSSSITIAKILKFDDPRKKGSKNAGATNILRYAGKLPAAITLIGDFSKGYIAVLIGKYFMMTEVVLGLICLASVCGHIFPIFYNFKGGKGVAVFIGVSAGISPLTSIIFCLSWLIIARITKYSSLSAIISVLFSVPIIFYDKQSVTISSIFSIIVLVIIVKHRDNIIRLRRGTEQKIGQKNNNKI